MPENLSLNNKCRFPPENEKEAAILHGKSEQGFDRAKSLSREKGRTYVAEGSSTEQDYMDKLEHFVRVRTRQVEASNYQYNLRQFFDAAAVNYRKPERASGQGGKRSS